ncbi:MAG: GGDEF and EAL domain-containing protein [Oscillospiraceae bacterium]|nr:GGDEF and EAL domain-containing protein [Oscillospiraceae bacterium]
MANKLNMSLQKERKRVRLRTRLTFFILTVLLLQLLTSVSALIMGGEFRELEAYSYNTVMEKTKNRGEFLQSELVEKAALVQSYADRIDDITARLMAQRHKSAADLAYDMELTESLISSSVDTLMNLLRRSRANGAYLLLDTGELYAGEGGSGAMAAVYLRNAATGAEDDDFQLVLGPHSIIYDHGDISEHYGWARFFTPDEARGDDYDFYFMPLNAARENSELSRSELGYWSRFSTNFTSVTPSMKYSLPLIAADGAVYGVVGIGLTEETILSLIPSDDFTGSMGCYVLGCGTAEKGFDIITYSGSSYSTLLGSSDTISVISKKGEGVYDFKMVKDVEVSGGVQQIELYGDNSPYAEDRWSLISVLDKSSLLGQLLLLKRLLLISALMSLLVASIIAVVGCRVIMKPLSDLSKKLKVRREYNEVLRFQPSNVYEIDDITDAITRIQIDIQGVSSQVSKMISIADVGLGTFMYLSTEDNVFVGQSLIGVLRLDLPGDGDVVMKRQEFLNSIKYPELQTPIANGMDLLGGRMREESSGVYEIAQPNGSKLWMRLSYTYSPNTAIGIVQDITAATLEKNRIEYERDYDHLTGLLNRQAYYRRVERLFQEKSKLGVTAFIMLDLDNLKYVNDTYGHNFGDDYIKTAATALKKFHDHGGIVSRLSGDEFSICLPGFTSKDEARKIINDVRGEMLSASCLLADGTHFRVNGSMGISWYPDDSTSREILMKYADFAMYTVKHSTKGGIAEFDWNVYSTDSVLLTGVEEMNRVIEEQSVKYAFQSIVSVESGRVYGYEALMRVQSEIFQSPLELIRTAKSGAKLHEIEFLTLTKALADFKALADNGKIEKNAYVFINSIANHRLEPETEAAIEKEYSDMLDRIVIEILESESSDGECSAHKAELVHNKWGGQLALDDFGTGYNSEYTLLTLRPNIVKIDRSIISGCDNDNDRRMIIENLVKLAKTKGIMVLAEGVETKEEMETVIRCGVDLLQGYYLAHPLFDPGPLSPELSAEIRRLAKQKETF